MTSTSFTLPDLGGDDSGELVTWLVEAGETVCTITNPFKTDATEIEAPFTGLLIGVPENPLVYPRNPLCHLVVLEGTTLRAFRQVNQAAAT